MLIWETSCDPKLLAMVLYTPVRHANIFSILALDII